MILRLGWFHWRYSEPANKNQIPMQTDFRDSLIKAMRKACDDMLRFSGNPAMRINAEYLFTVAVAKQIDELNWYYGDPYQIYLEKRTRDFAKDCIHPFKLGNSKRRGASMIRNGSPKLSRNGRIDIAIYGNILNNGHTGSQPMCAIELKGFNPAKNLVLKDLRRNLEYFSNSGCTGESLLGSTLFGALHSWSNLGTEAEEDQKYESLRRKYQGWLSQLPQVPCVRSAVTVHEVRKELEGEVIDDVDCKVLNTDAIHNFAGIVVEFNASPV